ncbi:VOC family protein [Brevibacillus antibioticus]|uniref:VOC family protein n=1 Tax=Brevibacillus antibioticus TaxID=2570228 RepID=A0A4U2Y6X6_9BACL|nr:VOC family protein [Brevibacillus antibioticus]TKI55562.1 VOC family protein [Brevibacillus antibioticus]
MNFHQSPNTFVRQVNLKVQNLERSLAYYQAVIGFKILNQSATKAELTADGKTALLSIEQLEDAFPKQNHTTGLYHFALLLPKRSDLASVERHFSALNLRIGSSDHLVSEALYLSDPDGNGIEIYVDRDPDSWNWHEGIVDMATEPLNFTDLLSSGEQAAWKGLPAGTIMGHIHLHVSKLNEAEHFYTKGLGFEVVNRYGTQALFISTGKYHHHIGLNTWAGVGAPPPHPKSPGLESFVLVLPNEEARNRVITQVREIGASVREESGHFVTEDPSGNRIQLHI